MSASFRFAVVADTHTRPEAGDLSSPWEVNKLANGRARHVAACIDRARPVFTVHLGDVVHPVPSLPTFDEAAGVARGIFDALQAPVHYVPGNHDVGDKPFPAMPAAVVSDAGVAAYQRHFGAPHGAFDHEGCHFVLLNSPVINSGLDAEHAQRVWLEADLEANRDRRIFLFTHYPPYVLDRDEPSNYDNIDEPGRRWLLDLVEAYRVEAMFTGHVHNFFYHRHGVTECYLLPATSFFRQDYAELFRVDPAPEHGRNDAGKLGWFMVDVYPGGHVARPYRSQGRTLAPGASLAPEPPRIEVPHPKDDRRSPLGVHLRHPWAEVTTLPYNGPMDEFHRKRARNDHTVLTLWETGARRVRVPVSDLLDADTRARMVALHAGGQRFTLFAFGVPTPAVQAVLTEHRDLVDALEVIAPWADLVAATGALATLREQVGCRLNVSKTETSAEKRTEGSRFSHFVSYGFRLADAESLAAWRAEPMARRLDGLVFRVGLDADPLTEIPAIAALGRELGVRVVVNVRLASDNPAEYVADDDAIAGLVARAMVCAHACAEDADVFLDTWVDLDRGYFPRHGLYDRHFDPRVASFVYRHLNAVLGAHDELAIDAVRHEQGTAVVTMRAGVARLALACGAAPAMTVPEGWLVPGASVECLDLVRGTRLRIEPSADASRVVPPAPMPGPWLVVVGR
ncbi:MAG: metallophosphoesterase [Ectothiorhodospiraceae bacterium]|nr:metallophosphoesterase [Ectothiorhodospiraceae bacterium]